MSFNQFRRGGQRQQDRSLSMRSNVGETSRREPSREASPAGSHASHRRLSRGSPDPSIRQIQSTDSEGRQRVSRSPNWPQLECQTIGQRLPNRLTLRRHRRQTHDSTTTPIRRLHYRSLTASTTTSEQIRLSSDESDDVSPDDQVHLPSPTPPPITPPEPQLMVSTEQGFLEGLDDHDYNILQQWYAIQEQCGQGHFANVYMAVQDETGHRVAIKVQKVRPDTSVDILLKQKFIVDSLHRHPHPNIMSIIHTIYLQQLERLYIVTEYTPVGDLHQYMQYTNAQGYDVWRALPEHEARHFTEQIGRGLAHMHTFPIAHCDLKPENVLLFVNWEALIPGTEWRDEWRYDQLVAKLTDFGNSVPYRLGVDPPTIPPTILFNSQLCTLWYAAPESLPLVFGAQTLHYNTLPADRYSLGALLLSMLLGRSPFHEAWMDQLINQGDLEEIVRAMKRDVGYIDALVKPLNDELRPVLRQLLDPYVANRPTIDQFLNSKWFRRPKARGVRH